MGVIPRQAYDGVKFNRLDDILNAKKIGMSRIQHGKYVQKIIDGNRLAIEPCPFADNDFAVVEVMFGVCINLWTSKTDMNKHTQWHQIRTGNVKNQTIIHLHRKVDEIY